MSPLTVLAEAVTSIAREARRIAPMAAGIVWGVASVFVLVAISRGFETTQRRAIESLGDGFLLLRMNRGEQTRGDVAASSFVRLVGEDMDALRAGAPAVRALSPKAHNWFTRVLRGTRDTRGTTIGVDLEYAEICHVPLEPGGRWLAANDFAQELSVCVIGYGVRDELFGEEPYLGEQVEVTFGDRGGGDDDDESDVLLRKLTVVGALTDEQLAADSVYTSHERSIFMPFPVWERLSPRGFQFFVARPRTPDDRDLALAQMTEVLARRHGFDPEAEGTLVPYFDAIERARQVERVFGGLEVFLGAVGALILLLGAVGVANVVLMSVAARTSEFGLRRALGCRRRWIFAQVFCEAALVCVLSGTLGFGLGALGVDLLGAVELPEGFAAPRTEWEAGLLPGVLLLAVSLLAAAWPAGRAARVPVVEALAGPRL